ncbi:MAG: phosphohydrolase [Bacteroidia bacterium]|nr:phosphohydrolase [Bacteroidia bacterium]
MKNKSIIYTVLLLFCSFAKAQEVPLKLCFNKEGHFKIAQFTDMHLGKDSLNNQKVEELIEEVLQNEKPHFVVFTGDNTTMDDVEKGWSKIAGILSKHRTPWTAVLGNHDDEYAVKRKELITIIRRQPYCAMTEVAQNIKGEGNHLIPIYDSSTKSQIASLLYCLDSNGYSTEKEINGYGWIGLSQLNWYTSESQKQTHQNNGSPLPSLAFFHIPLAEYTEAWESMDSKRFGTRDEVECSAKLNSGLFTRMIESGDVMGIFVGHDHLNDYITTLHHIALAYGRASGGSNSYGDKKHGSRIIVLKEGERTFDTWIHEKEHSDRLFFCTYPTSFLKKK